MELISGPQIYKKATEAANYIRQRIPPQMHGIRVGVICGSGLGGLSSVLVGALVAEIPYEDIPHFPSSTVPGHAGKLVVGQVQDGSSSPVIMMVGRVHFYEGYTAHEVTYPVRVLKLLGVQLLIVTNAAGGLNPNYNVGDVVALSDHINFAGISGVHPLRGMNADDFGVRFPPLSEAYDLEMRRKAHQLWQDVTSSGRRLHEGVYAYVSGPSYETRAECRMLRMLGADLVGMSTVPEIIVARHCGIRILAFSLVTNSAVLEAGPTGNDPGIQAMTTEELKTLSASGKANHAEVLEEGRKAAADMQRLIHLLLKEEA